MTRDYKRYCEWCGKPFTSRHKTKRFCDHTCKSRAHHHMNRLKQETRVYDTISEYLQERERRDR